MKLRDTNPYLRMLNDHELQRLARERALDSMAIASPEWYNDYMANQKVKVTIDAGHGMGSRRPGVFDPGAIGQGGLREADIVLEWALAGKFVLEQAGFDVHLTRPDNQTQVPVGSRDDLATKNGSKFFISLHCNAASLTANGAEAFFRDSGDRKLATIALNALVKLGFRNRGVKNESLSQHNRLAVLDFKGDACLVEIGFITNVDDVRRMTSRDNRIAFWTEVAEQLKRYN